ncbi:hypothetical protein [Pandoraea oxalativorans]|uniref:Uncharacterized protein n=1 Tax=Pandoraea oxalativorans TaxID=573737 RepID=A0A0G3IE78_9BURK|nr:hypothetical protein [Pandoraea oxalativorans]AKK24858.1 hypothetical protein MB84_29245 [Pandoraea oxalativorans]
MASAGMENARRATPPAIQEQDARSRKALQEAGGKAMRARRARGAGGAGGARKIAIPAGRRRQGIETIEPGLHAEEILVSTGIISIRIVSIGVV